MIINLMAINNKTRSKCPSECRKLWRESSNVKYKDREI
jgi:hypothetical protein